MPRVAFGLGMDAVPGPDGMPGIPVHGWIGHPMSSTGQRRDQRRRLLVSWKSAAAEPGSTGASAPSRPLAEYAAEAHPERQRGPAVLLPTGVGGLALAALVILVPVIGTAVVGGWEIVAGRPLVAPAGRFARSLAALAACCDPRGSASLQAWLAQGWLMVAAAVALVVRLMRRHRRDDYRGRYRAWGWMAVLLVLAGLANSVPVGPLVAAVLVDATGIVLGPHGIGWWIAIAATAWLVVVPWAVLPLHERTGTAVWLGLALAAWAGAAAAEWLAAGRAAWIVGGRAAWAAGAALAAVAMLAAARSVIREVRGLAAAKPAGRAAAAARSAPAVRKAEAPAAVPADDVEVRFDAVTESAAADAEDDEAATRYVDGSEPEHRHLSKAERKRLKKLARMNRSVA